ncbi:MAG TPA: amidohydrolase [Caulobacteraceae bacterium]|nr:amidohydrolase [Caulobacteraceae bacterium]
MNRLSIFLGCVAVALAGPALAARSTPMTVYFDGKVYTVDDSLGVQSAFAVKGERIVAVGSDAQVLAKAGRGAKRVDLRGAAVIPGLSDSHDHFWNTTRFLVRGVDMIGVGSRAEFDARLRAAVAKASPGEIVYTTVGWAVTPAPTRADLDKISADTPILLIADRRGRSVANSAALRKLGVDKAHPTFHGAPVPVDAQGEPTGEPPGYPISVAWVEALIPPLTDAQKLKLLEAAQQERNALGITAVRDLAVWPDVVRDLQVLRRQGKLTLRIALGVEIPDQAHTAAWVAEQPPLKRDDPWLFVDSLSEEPWAPGSDSVEDYTVLARTLNRQGWRPAPHVSSDPHRGITADIAAEDALQAYEAANRDSPLTGKRWYMEHVPFATPEQMDRMAALGVVISVQDAGYDLPAVAPMPPDRMAHETPVRGLIDHHLTVIGGSDYNGPNPVERAPNNPLIDFYFYVTRRTRDGRVMTPDEKVSRAEALKILTANAAYATFQEKVRGRIAPGLLADFVILDQNLMTVPDDQILTTHPLATFVGGRKVYSASGSSF